LTEATHGRESRSDIAPVWAEAQLGHVRSERAGKAGELPIRLALRPVPAIFSAMVSAILGSEMSEPKTSNPQPERPSFASIATTLGLVAFAVVLITGAYRQVSTSYWTKALAQGPAKPESGPLLVREGDRIIVPEGSPLRAKLTVEAVAEQQIQRTLVLPAVVEADPSRLVKVLPPLAGRITQLQVQLGERVKEGQALAVLDSPDLGTAYADHERATVLLELARKNRDRARDLSKIGGAAVRELQQAETDYVTADVEHHRADARLKQIGVNPETSDPMRTVTITAPIAGSVIELDVGAGAFWNDPNASLLTIADLSSVWVTANVPEKDTALVAKGQLVEVVFGAYPNEVFKGEVLFVSDVLDPDTRRTKVRIAFPNPGIRLKPNMFANVSFLTPVQMVATVPATALVMKNDGDRVFVEVAPWTFVPRSVETSYQQGNSAVIKSGLVAGERAVVKGGVLLND
jgi:cobalt-zinc-cadmium efflux system membrane fusion protein